ncbi:pheromone-binding protein Gp-9-like [Diabrotica undecimpunctata]|uniref:pheromone-binding protein Gp-9-like n=1 Tax=Diabrotica undecimpunctata TaxID=50387 RepID=UPI003B634239
MTKIFTFIAIAVAICIQSSRADDKPEGMDECLKKSGAVADDIAARPHKDTNEVRCFWKCILEKQGAIDGSGAVKPDLFEKAFPKDSAHFSDSKMAVLKTCFGAIDKIESCDDMNKIHECYAKAEKP